jgi:hypothetical protein
LAIDLREEAFMATLQELAIRIISDDTFAQDLLADPEAVLHDEGIEPTPEMLEAINGIDLEELRRLTAAFTDESKAM